MNDHEQTRSHADRLTISPSLDLVVEAALTPPEAVTLDRRILHICGLTILLGFISSGAAWILVRLIAGITNLAFYQRLSLLEVSPAAAVAQLGAWVILIPVAGAVVIGFMARYGSRAIRGHGIPEAMEQILANESRIPARVMFLKPVSAAISIGTGGPFGAEGPIIATGAAIGSVLGQILRISAAERKTLLAAGAAAGMAATFGSPLSAVLLAVELLLFEFRPRSLIPVALAAFTAAGMRILSEGAEPVFVMAGMTAVTPSALLAGILLGGLMGVAAMLVTRAVYAIEDAFEQLPIHWMWWPALGGLAVGLVGWFAPRTLGVGYDNISDLLSGQLTVPAICVLCGMKFLSWSISLGSGTSGGTLAPLLTIGGGLGVLLGGGIQTLFPAVSLQPGLAALIGMAALFAGASRAMLASAVFAVEATHQLDGLLPLLGGCAAAYLTSTLLMRHSIMTEKIARRGIRTPVDYEADLMDQVAVAAVMSTQVEVLSSQESLAVIRERLKTGSAELTHQGFPVVDGQGHLTGVVTRRELLDPQHAGPLCVQDLIRRPPCYVYADCSVRQAAEHMVRHSIGRLPVVDRQQPTRVAGIVTRSDLLSVLLRRVEEGSLQEPLLKIVPRGKAIRPAQPSKTTSQAGNTPGSV